MVTDQIIDATRGHQDLRRFLRLGPSASDQSAEILHDWAASPSISSEITSLRTLDDLSLEFRFRDNMRASLNAIHSTLENPDSPTTEVLSAVSLFLRLCETSISGQILGTSPPRTPIIRAPRPAAELNAPSIRPRHPSPRFSFDPSAAHTNGATRSAPDSGASPTIAKPASPTIAEPAAPTATESAATRGVHTGVPIASPHADNGSAAQGTRPVPRASESPRPNPGAVPLGPNPSTSAPNKNGSSHAPVRDRKRPAADLLACAGTTSPFAKSAAWP